MPPGTDGVTGTDHAAGTDRITGTDHEIDVPGRPRGVTTGLGDAPPRRLLRGAEQLSRMIGKQLLVGVTLRPADGGTTVRRQFHGPVLDVEDGVVVLDTASGPVLLPADPDAYERARPGTYRLADGEVVTDPDFLATWVIRTDPDDDRPGR